jgi:hypothetical protein
MIWKITIARRDAVGAATCARLPLLLSLNLTIFTYKYVKELRGTHTHTYHGERTWLRRETFSLVLPAYHKDYIVFLARRPLLFIHLLSFK